MSSTNSEFSFEIVKNLGTLKEADRPGGYALECKLVRWNNAATPKIDVRSWQTPDPERQIPGYTRMSRGITLSDSEAERLAQAIAEHLNESRA